MQRDLYEADHDAFRETVRAFLDREVVPHLDKWDSAGIVDRELFATAGRAGLLGMAVSEQYGGGGVDDFRFNAVIGEEAARAGAAAAGLGITLHNDIALPYFLIFGYGTLLTRVPWRRLSGWRRLGLAAARLRLRHRP